MPPDRDKAKRWRPWQFSLSHVLLLMVIVGLSVAWQLDRTRLLKENYELRARVIDIQRFWQQDLAAREAMKQTFKQQLLSIFEKNRELEGRLKEYKEPDPAVGPPDAGAGP